MVGFREIRQFEIHRERFCKFRGFSGSEFVEDIESGVKCNLTAAARNAAALEFCLPDSWVILASRRNGKLN